MNLSQKVRCLNMFHADSRLLFPVSPNSALDFEPSNRDDCVLTPCDHRMMHPPRFLQSHRLSDWPECVLEIHCERRGGRSATCAIRGLMQWYGNLSFAEIFRRLTAGGIRPLFICLLLSNTGNLLTRPLTGSLSWFQSDAPIRTEQILTAAIHSGSSHSLSCDSMNRLSAFMVSFHAPAVMLATLGFGCGLLRRSAHNLFYGP